MSLDVSLEIAVDTGGVEPHTVELFSRNITHNVSPMWTKAGMHHAMYVCDGEIAGGLVGEIDAGIKAMEVDPAGFTALNPANGWGDYESALDFARAWFAACAGHPKATVRISR